MTTAKPPARYSAMESARSGDFATPELHHPSGHDRRLGRRERLSSKLCPRGLHGALRPLGPAACLPPTAIASQGPERSCFLCKLVSGMCEPSRLSVGQKMENAIRVG